jgi:hypothetical protein
MTYGECVNALRDPALKAQRMSAVLSVKFPGRSLPPNNIYHRFTNNVMMYTDDPVHDSLRRSTAAGFTSSDASALQQCHRTSSPQSCRNSSRR